MANIDNRSSRIAPLGGSSSVGERVGNAWGEREVEQGASGKARIKALYECVKNGGLVGVDNVEAYAAEANELWGVEKNRKCYSNKLKAIGWVLMRSGNPTISNIGIDMTGVLNQAYKNKGCAIL